MKFIKGLIIICLIFAVFTTAAGAEMVSQVIVGNNLVTITGKIDPENKETRVSIFLLYPDKTLADFETDFLDSCYNFNMIEVGERSTFSYSFIFDGPSGDYLLYLKSGNQTHQMVIDPTLNNNITFEKQIHVSPNGNDLNGGTIEAPLKTLEGARLAARKIADGVLPVTVIFHEGEYPVTKKVTFNSDDSGFPLAPTTYKAAEGEKVSFTGAKSLDVSGFVTSEDARIHENAKGRVVMLDLAANGITRDMIDMTKSLDEGHAPIIAGFYLNNRRQILSRWPNIGYKIIGQTTKGGVRRFNENPGLSAVMSFTDDAPLNWTTAPDAYIEGYFATEYWGEWAKIGSIDTQNRKITFDNWTQYGVESGYRWAAINLLEEIDIPGEWYVDKNTMTLYYYPPYTLNAQEDVFEIGILNDSFISILGAEYINFDNLHFSKNANDYSKNSEDVSAGIKIELSKNIEITNCTISDIARSGIYAVRSTGILIDGCDIYNTGLSGIHTVDCGDRQNLTSSGNIISNNRVYETGRDDSTSSYVSVRIEKGVGALVKNNIVHKSPAGSIYYSGNENLIQYNECYNALRNAADGGVIYAGRSWSEYGSIVEYNYLHDYSIPELDHTNTPNAVFFDDLHSGNTLRYNIMFSNRGTTKGNATGIKVGGGRDNNIHDNTIINMYLPVLGENRTVNRGIDITTEDPYRTLTEIPYNMPPYSTKYPNMASIYSDIIAAGNVFWPQNNKIVNNLFVDADRDPQIAGQMSSTGTISNPPRRGDYTIFADPANQDFRVKTQAKVMGGIPDNILDTANFDMNDIGLKRHLSRPATPFKQLYPSNISTNTDLTLIWEAALFSDQYLYTLSTDSNFNNIVRQGTTYNTMVDISGLLPATKYYWRVEAQNTSRQLGNNWNSQGISSFTTKGEVIEVLETEIWQSGQKINSIAGRNGDFVLKLRLKNNTDQSLNLSPILGLKNPQGRLLEAVIPEAGSDSTLSANANSVWFTINFSLSNVVQTGDILDCYLWESGSMRPLGQKTELK